jgi:hypothetical protein
LTLKVTEALSGNYGRELQTGIGDVEVKVLKVRDRIDSGVKFNSNLLPPYLKELKVLKI